MEQKLDAQNAARLLVRSYRFNLKVGDIRFIHPNHVPIDLPVGRYAISFGEGRVSPKKHYALAVREARDAVLERV